MNADRFFPGFAAGWFAGIVFCAIVNTYCTPKASHAQVAVMAREQAEKQLQPGNRLSTIIPWTANKSEWGLPGRIDLLEAHVDCIEREFSDRLNYLETRVDSLAVLIDSLFKLQQPAPVKARGR